MPGLLDGVKVVEWSAFAFGPLSGLMLADLGADVIKVEDPRSGDPARGARWMIGSVDCGLPGGRNALFETFNRNKRSVALNLKTEAGREVLFQLLEDADVFIHNFRQTAADKLGLGYPQVHARFPRLIYAVGSGYGPNGPDAHRPGLDYVGQARSGLMWGTGAPSDPPFYNTGGTADMIGGITLAFAVAVALLGREKAGTGQRVDVSHIGASMWLQKWAIGVSQLTGLTEWPRFDREAAGNPLWNHYKCRDDKWIALALLQADRYWPDFVQAIDHLELLTDERFADVEARREHNRDLIPLLESVFLSQDRAYWDERFRSYPDFIYDRVQSISELAYDEQVLENKYLVPHDYPGIGQVLMQTLPVTFSHLGHEIRTLAPSLGEHTYETLRSLGFSDEAIGALAEEGAI